MIRETINNRFQAAQVLIREAGILAHEWFRNRRTLIVEKKGSHDWVSKADHEVEMFIKKKLESMFPEDGFLGEEFGFLDQKKLGIWVVDPIDGTTCFLKGLSSWCVSIAFVVNNKIEIGLIYAPCTDELFAVQRGGGATLNGKKIKSSNAKSLSEGIVALGYSPKQSIIATKKALEFILNEGAVFHEIGSAALMIAYVASGRYIGFYEFHLNSWDCLAGIALVKETGGWANDFLSNNGLHEGNAVLVSAHGTKKAMLSLFSYAGHKI